MDDLYAQVFEKIEKSLALQRDPIPRELEEISYPFHILQMRCSNWRSERIDKMYSMRLKLLMPSLNIFGVNIYPSQKYEVPMFLFDLSCTRKKIVAFINITQISNTPKYIKKYIDPFARVRKKYDHLPARPLPAWLEAYKSTGTIYAHPSIDQLGVLKACVMEYLQVYLEILASAPTVESCERQQHIKAFHEKFKFDLTTKDGARHMLAKVIGKNRAARIYNEVLV